jgi:hypothetical protein
VTDVNLVEVRSTGIVFDDTEVVFDTIDIGMSSKLLELFGAGLLGSLLLNQCMRIDVLIGEVSLSCSWGWARIDARNFEGVLHSLAYRIRGMATLWDFRNVVFSEDRIVFLTIHDPDIHNGNRHIVHAIGREFIGFTSIFGVVV